MSTKPNKIKTSKYTRFTFFPLNIYYQFTKYNNLFFFITLILLCIPTISPFTPFTYMVAFSLILGISMIKDALEDKRRHDQDRAINERPAFIIKNNTKYQVRVEDINTGDIIMVSEQEEVPADLILISARGHRGCRSFCFVETSNLDGENNLKRKAIGLRDDLCECINISSGAESPGNLVNANHQPSPCDIKRINALKSYSVEETGELLNDIKCILRTSTENFLQTDKNVLLKGCRIKNTQYVVGLTIGVGTHTKQSKNQRVRGLTVSIFEKSVNKRLTQIFILYFIILTVTSMLCSLFVKTNDYPYLFLNPNRATEALKLTGTNYILYSYLIPISLFVTIEVARILMSLFISHDPALMKHGINSNCRNSNVVEDIGVIEHILTDKTGTLTKNEMELKFMHLYKNRGLYKMSEGKIDSLIEGNDKSLLGDPFSVFLFALLTCNSCERFNGRYEGPSQDEICILEGLKEYGEIISRQEKTITIKHKNRVITLPILMLLEFTSKRQRMSIVTTIEDKIILFTKGSDQKVLKNSKDAAGAKEIIDNNSFYRSLVVSYKEIKDKSIIDRYEQIGLNDRTRRIEALFEEIEKNMNYLGTTFVEDSIEDGVKKSIEDFGMAGIRVWMVTGDKKETAMSCGRLCGLAENRNDTINVRENNPNNSYTGNNSYNSTGHNSTARNYNTTRNYNTSNTTRNDSNVNSWESNIATSKEEDIISKNTSTESQHSAAVNCLIVSAEDMIKKLERSDNLSERAIIYRASPEQKAKIAKLLVNRGVHTLAIGDGNNDVMMLQSSHVGVGIKGNEGTQASISSDFALPSFVFLKRLLFVHGRFNYIRFSKLTVNSVYKNLMLIFVQFYYNFHNGYSGRSAFNALFLNYFNVLFTSLIPLYIALFDKDREEEDIMANPEKYKEAKRYFNNNMVILNIFMAIFKASIIYWFIYGIFCLKDFTRGNGLIGGYSALNNCLSILVFLTIFIRQIRTISWFNIFSYIFIGITVMLYFGVVFGIQEFSAATKNSAFHLYSMPVFYFAFVAVMGLVLFFDFLYDIMHKKIL